MKKLIISAAVLGLLAIAPAAFAQSTVTGTLSSGGTSSTSTGSGTPVTGTVGSGNSLSGTVTSTSTSSSGGGGVTTTTGSNGPPVGSGGVGGGAITTVICPNLPASLYSLPAGYELVNGNCDPINATTTTAPGIPNTGTTVPGIPNTGAGGNAQGNDLLLLASGLLGTFASGALLRKHFAR